MPNDAIEGVDVGDAARCLFEGVVFGVVIAGRFNVVSRVKLKMTPNANSQ